MPYRNYRGVNRAVQDEEEIKRLKEEDRKKRRAKAKRWCYLIGLTVVEFVLCLICFILGYYYYHSIEEYRNKHRIKHDPNTVRYILEPPTPLAIASVFLTLTYIDLVSWHSLRPVTYFGWIMVSTAGFLLFLLYAGCIILSCNHIAAYLAIFFGCITALVFLGDLICSLLSLKRFPVPYWVLKRKYEKMEQCVCTADYDPEEAEVERPICRCGDHWGEPCTCDDPDTTCGCGADKKGKPPCECCECATIVVTSEDADTATIFDAQRQSIISTMSGRDTAEEPRKTIFSQVNLPQSEEQFCFHGSSIRHCIDGLPQSAPMGQSIYVDTMGEPFVVRKSLAPSQANLSRKSAYAQRQSVAYGTIGTSPSKFVHTSLIAPSRAQSVGRQSMAPNLKSRQSVAVSAKTAPSVARGLTNPSFDQAVKMGLHEPLTETLGAPTMGMASRMALPKTRKSMAARKSQFAYSVYTTKVDDEEELHKTLECKYHRKKKERDDKSIFHDEMSKSSSEDELGEGDYPRKSVNKKRNANVSKKFGYASDPEIIQNDNKFITLPGQSLDDNHHHIMKNVSVSARERCSRRCTSIIRHVDNQPQYQRPATTAESVGAPRIIRNVSTTVRAVRTLSKVMEAENESRSVSQSDNRGTDQFPSECTITINK